jgi:hypothetical protein
VGQASLTEFVGAGPKKGAFYQGGRDDRLILVYVGKCLNPLLVLHDEFREPRFLEAANALAQYLVGCVAERGVFINYEQPDQHWPRFHYLESLAHRVAGSPGVLTRWRRSRITSWTRCPYPSFVARAGDTVRALWRLSETRSELEPLATRLTHRILSAQLPHGGIRNTYGWYGDPDEVHWQDLVCPTRWNGYAFHLLCDLSVRLGVDEIPSAPNSPDFYRASVGADQSEMLYEDGAVVSLNRGTQCRFEIDKTTGKAVTVAEDLSGEVTGPRTMQA